MSQHVLLDKRHVNQTVSTFTPHFKIMKANPIIGLADGREWLLYCHVTIARWKLLNRYETQQEAMSATDLEWSA